MVLTKVQANHVYSMLKIFNSIDSAGGVVMRFEPYLRFEKTKLGSVWVTSGDHRIKPETYNNQDDFREAYGITGAASTVREGNI